MKRPGNLRTIAVTLKTALQRVVDPTSELDASLIVDGEPFHITVADGRVDVRASQVDDPNAILETNYEAMVAVADGRMSLDEFVLTHARLSGANPTDVNALASWMTDAVTLLRGER